jgi:hypothetical protein
MRGNWKGTAGSRDYAQALRRHRALIRARHNSTAELMG